MSPHVLPCLWPWVCSVHDSMCVRERSSDACVVCSVWKRVTVLKEMEQVEADEGVEEAKEEEMDTDMEKKAEEKKEKVCVVEL